MNSRGRGGIRTDSSPISAGLRHYAGFAFGHALDDDQQAAIEATLRAATVDHHSRGTGPDTYRIDPEAVTVTEGHCLVEFTLPLETAETPASVAGGLSQALAQWSREERLWSEQTRLGGLRAIGTLPSPVLDVDGDTGVPSAVIGALQAAHDAAIEGEDHLEAAGGRNHDSADYYLLATPERALTADERERLQVAIGEHGRLVGDAVVVPEPSSPLVATPVNPSRPMQAPPDRAFLTLLERDPLSDPEAQIRSRYFWRREVGTLGAPDDAHSEALTARAEELAATIPDADAEGEAAAVEGGD